jgi:DinB superfamily
MRYLAGAVLLLLVVISNLGLAQSQRPPQTAAQSLSAGFNFVHKQILDMAKDFPEEKYGFRLRPEMRSFGEVIVHVASGTVYAAKAGMGEKVKWDELDPKNYRGKAAIVALLEKAIADAQAAMKQNPEGPAKNLQPFLDVMEHSAEHYGLLVAYYRANGIVPPASRPKK